ncbi:hypothetical protein GCM10027072_61350 [Streptomyces bullii]
MADAPSEASPVRYAQELVAGIAHAALEMLDTAHLAVEDPRALRAVLQARLDRVDTRALQGFRRSTEPVSMGSGSDREEWNIKRSDVWRVPEA